VPEMDKNNRELRNPTAEGKNLPREPNFGLWGITHWSNVIAKVFRGKNRERRASGAKGLRGGS